MSFLETASSSNVPYTIKGPEILPDGNDDKKKAVIAAIILGALTAVIVGILAIQALLPKGSTGLARMSEVSLSTDSSIALIGMFGIILLTVLCASRFCQARNSTEPVIVATSAPANPEQKVCVVVPSQPAEVTITPPLEPKKSEGDEKKTSMILTPPTSPRIKMRVTIQLKPDIDPEETPQPVVVTPIPSPAHSRISQTSKQNTPKSSTISGFSSATLMSNISRPTSSLHHSSQKSSSVENSPPLAASDPSSNIKITLIKPDYSQYQRRAQTVVVNSRAANHRRSPGEVIN